MKKKLSKITILILTELALVLAVFAVLHFRKLNVFDASITEWQSGVVNYDRSWYIDESVSDNDERIALIYGPFKSLKKGHYDVDIYYHTDENQIAVVATDEGQDELNYLDINLYKYRDHINSNFYLGRDVKDFQLVVLYDGNGSLEINDIGIYENRDLEKLVALGMIIAYAVIDLIIIYRNYLRENWMSVLIMGIIIIVASLPTFNEWIRSGHDITFHYQRIVAIANSLRNHEFPPRICAEWYDYYGYPVTMMYPHLFLYIPAFLYLMGMNLADCLKSFIFICNAATAIISYVCFKKMFKNNNAALASSGLYTLGTYRMVNIYIRSVVGEYQCFTFLPLLVYAIYRIYTEDIKDNKTMLRLAIFLAIACTCIAQCHILTILMIIFMFVIFTLIRFKKTFNLYTIKTFLCAGVMILLLNAFYLVPFMDYSAHMPMAVTTHASSMEIISYGMKLGTLLNVTSDQFNNFFEMTVGLCSIVVLIASIPVLFIKKDKELILYFFLSVLSLFMSSYYFPWKFMTDHFLVFRLLSNIQFTWRFLGIAYVFIALLCGKMLSLLNKNIFSYTVILLSLITVGIFMFQYYENTPLNFMSRVINENSIDYSEIYDGLSGREYDLQGTNQHLYSHRIVTENADAYMLERRGVTTKLYVSNVGNNATVEVPISNYMYYHATAENGDEFEIVDGDQRSIKILMPDGYPDGVVTVAFKEPLFWRISELVSLISLIGVVVLSGKVNKKSEA